MLVKTPSKMTHDRARSSVQSVTPDPAALQLKRFPNSVDTLAPNNRFVVAINKIPITPWHSLLHHRGRPGTW